MIDLACLLWTVVWRVPQAEPGQYSCVTYLVDEVATCNPMTSTHTVVPIEEEFNAGCTCRCLG